MSDRIVELLRELESLARPLAKTRPDATTALEMEVRASKLEWVELRESLGLSRRAAARLLGRSPSTIDGWESLRDCERAPPAYVFRTLLRLAREGKCA